MKTYETSEIKVSIECRDLFEVENGQKTNIAQEFTIKAPDLRFEYVTTNPVEAMQAFLNRIR